MDDKITYFAEANFRGKNKKFGIKKPDRRKHMYVIGKTGMGKTTLLENLAMQDIRNGEGIAFIDPHGDTAAKLLNFVPESRIKDVIYFDPADTDFPIGFNVMENVDPERRHFVASGLMGVFKKIFGVEVWSARMEYILNNTVLALLESPDSTLLNINPMLAVKEFRKKVVESVTDPVVKAFWTQEFAKYTERFAAEATPAIQNKIGQFTSNSLIRNIVGQPKSAFDFRKVMDEKKIMIINLAKGRVGEDAARLLGAMIVTKLYLAAMSRVDQPEEEKRSDFFLYVDEFQNFATESFANILSEARKYRLSLLLAHQYMAQLDEKVRDAVIGNIGTMVSFRVGAEDAEFFEKEFSPEFTAQDIVNLGFASIYLKLMIDGIASRPFSATTLGPIQVEESSFKNEIIESSRKIYSSSRAEVERRIVEWQENLDKDKDTAEKTEKPKFDARPKFEGVCAICGKKVEVPFEPDPARPIFCKDHLSMAGQHRTPSRNIERSRPQQNDGFISLKNLRRSPSHEISRPARPSLAGGNDLSALREALKKSLEKPKEETTAKTLKPGDKIEL
ncbi:MAG: type IV secretion system DNA-binding domain-containing protein [Patescibacteria group bacterium]